jgi:hypothetical protein
MRRFLIFSFGLLFILFTSSSATIINVPGDQLTIQLGIDIASDGDTVLVAPGTYYEHIDFSEKNIVVKSVEGYEQTTIEGITIDVPIVSIIQSASGATIEGFTITNASSSSGIHVHTSNITIKFNHIVDNHGGSGAFDNGGGIFCEYSSGIINGNIVENNSSVSSAGIGIWNSDNVYIDSNIVFNNVASFLGGGVWSRTSDSIFISHNIVYNNTAANGPIGLGAYESDYVYFFNNTVDGNTGINHGSITIFGSDYIYLENNIVTNAIGLYGVYADYSTEVSVTYTDSWNNQNGDYYGVTQGIGTISLDPLYVDSALSDYNLQSNSPCIDAGNPDSPYDPDGTIADMGALYYDQVFGIQNFHLIGPADDSILNDTSALLIWQSTIDLDSGFVVSYNLIWDDDEFFASPDSSGTMPDTTYEIIDILQRSTEYYWKVLASTGYSDPLYSEETWSFYINGYPTPPTAISPDNMEYCDSLTYITWLVGTDPDSFDIVFYTIQIDEDSLFATPEVNQSGLTSGTILDDAFAIRINQLEGYENLLPDTWYYWRVRSDDNYGLSSVWPDSLLYFKYLDQNHPPFPPDSGFSPANGEEVISLTPTITWNDATDPDPDDISDSLFYDFYLFEDTSTGGQEYRDTTAQGINQVTVSDSLHDNAHFYYQVKTIDDEGLASDWSTLQNFWTNNCNFPPEPFLLISPDSAYTQVIFYTHFAWANPIDYDPMTIITFKLEYSADSLFTAPITAAEGFTDTTLNVETDQMALLGDQIYWRVWAFDDDSLSRIGGIPEHCRSFRILPPGDANTSGNTNGLDVTYLVAYLKGVGPAPDPILAGDANGNCQTNGLDVTYLVNYFKGIGPNPVRGICDPILLGKEVKPTEVEEQPPR